MRNRHQTPLWLVVLVGVLIAVLSWFVYAPSIGSAQTIAEPQQVVCYTQCYGQGQQRRCYVICF